MSTKVKGKKVLVTGISGFVGNALGKKLEKDGVELFGTSRTMQKKKIFTGDILDYTRLNDFVKRNKIDAIIHLAGESLVESGQSDPFSTFKINTEGTLNILEIARKNNLERVIIASSSHVYGKNKVPYYEGYMPRPSRPYETSKACTDLIAQSYSETFNLPVLIPRFVNIYGPGDLNFTRLIPKTIKTLLAGEKPEMWGGQAMREYLYVDDAISAYLKLLAVDLQKVDKNRIFNIGSGDVISVKELIEKIINKSEIESSINKIDDKRELEINTQYVSTKKTKRVLQWEAKTHLDEGLTKTIAWYRKFFYNN